MNEKEGRKEGRKEGEIEESQEDRSSRSREGKPWKKVKEGRKEVKEGG